MDLTNFSSDNFIIMNFPTWSGGKFISNCLSLSQYCVPQDPQTARYLISMPKDYQYRYDAVIRSLPPSQNEMKHWITKYEFGDTQLYGANIQKLWSAGIRRLPETNLLVEELLNTNLKLFFVAHATHIMQNFLKVWPNSTIIKLINHTKFSDIAARLKCYNYTSLRDYVGNFCQENYTEIAGNSWPTWKEFESVGYDIKKLNGYSTDIVEEILQFYPSIDATTYLFDIDSNIFDRIKFLDAMRKLYEQLGFDDFNEELVGNFWQSYMNLHIDNTEIK